MRRRIRGATAWSAGIASAALLLAAPSSGRAQDAPQNLQVLSSDLTRPQLFQIMRGFTAALGVRCSTCHVGEEGQPLSTYDFASDEKSMKVKARAMLRMSRAINDTYLADLPGRRDPGVDVTCVTCHRGVSRPEPIEVVLGRTLEDDGVDAALERYRALRERYYGGFAYDFTDRPVVALAEQVMESDRSAAQALLEMALEYDPGSARTLLSLAQLHDGAGDAPRAIEFYRKVLEVQPDNPQVRARLRELGGGG